MSDRSYADVATSTQNNRDPAVGFKDAGMYEMTENGVLVYGKHTRPTRFDDNRRPGKDAMAPRCMSITWGELARAYKKNPESIKKYMMDINSLKQQLFDIYHEIECNNNDDCQNSLKSKKDLFYELSLKMLHLIDQLKQIHPLHETNGLVSDDQSNRLELLTALSIIHEKIGEVITEQKSVDKDIKQLQQDNDNYNKWFNGMENKAKRITDEIKIANYDLITTVIRIILNEIKNASVNEWCGGTTLQPLYIESSSNYKKKKQYGDKIRSGRSDKRNKPKKDRHLYKLACGHINDEIANQAEEYASRWPLIIYSNEHNRNIPGYYYDINNDDYYYDINNDDYYLLPII